jgi:protocatechuate 3,4-dioxygenase beta subunit
MSTKTTFKRVALVAVAALGFGVLTSVAPASADQTTAAELGAVAIATPGTGRVGNALSSAVSITAASGTDLIASGDNITLRGAFISRPAGSAATVAFSSTGAVTPFVTTAGTFTAAGAAGNELAGARFVLTTSAALDDSAGAKQAGVVGFIPDVVGDYVVRVWHDVDLDGLYDADEDKATDTTFTVGNPAVAASVSIINGTSVAGGTYGSLVKLTLTDAAGAVAGLAGNESVTIVTNATSAVYAINGTTTSAAAGDDTTLVAANFKKGIAWLNLTDSAEETATFSISSTGITNPLTGTFTVKYYSDDSASDTATTVIQGSTAGAAFTSVTDGINGSSTTATIPVATKTITYYTSGTTGIATGDYAAATVTDSNGYVTGSVAQAVTGLSYDVAYVLTETTVGGTTIAGTFSVTLTSPAADAVGFNATTTAGTNLVSGVTTAAALTATATVVPASTTPIHLKNGSSITFTVTVKDQFGRALPNVTVTQSGGSRNATAAVAPTGVSDALGKVQFTVKDAPATASAALLTSDTFTFTATGGSAATAGALTWSATGPVVGTVTLTTGTEDDTASAITYRDISASATGTQAGAATVTATVKDANGNLLVGVPVTFSTASAGAAVLSTSVVGYTGAAGTVTASVYGWTAGTKTITATAGEKSGSGTVNYKQQTATDVRTIAAKVEGSIVTVTASDRFGNTVEGVKIYGTKTGTGYFGNGSSTSSATTDKNGVAEFVVQGTGSFKFAAGDSTAADLEYGDTDAVAGKVGATAVTAYAAGTALAAEKGVGDTFAPAGVNSVSLDIAVANASEAAADAAAEATDAANAATDAANAAAEAADAATAAAQDAADAVAALSTQVSEMVNALKKQITALTNLVIKIQKKVRA